MRGRFSSMLFKKSLRPGKFATCLVLSAFFWIVSIQSSFSQEPPLDVPAERLPARDPNAIAVDGWLLYPTLRTYTLYSDNLFLSPITPISVPGFGINPGLTAEWSNGIHTTTLYGDVDHQDFPTDTEVNTLDGRAGFTQRYEAMRDLIFTVNGDYTHQTWATGLQSSIQTSAIAPATTILPNGNTQLPNGTILSPTGQPVGQATPPIGSLLPLVVNPHNQYTGTFSVEKIFNRGILTLSGSANRTDYDNQTLQSNTRSKTFTEDGAFWLGPLFYAYSNGSIGTVVTETTSTSTTSYRVIGGLGTRQFGLFRSSLYFGHQGSQSDNTMASTANSSAAGGDVYGGSISYYPTHQLTLTGTVDRTINISSQSAVTNLALSLPSFVGVQVPLTASTRITAASLQSTYQITPQWFASALLGYTRINYIDSPRLDNSWLVDATLRYDVWRNMALTWEYRYSSILSNAPLVSATSNYVTMGATYKF
jgi:Putative beta-barrel porin 2